MNQNNKQKAKIIVDKFADLMLPTKERLNELQWMIEMALNNSYQDTKNKFGGKKNKMKEEYKPETLEQKLGYLIEECGELQSALGKTIRWGLESYNPEPNSDKETNRCWILREIKDVQRAIRFLKAEIDD